MKFHFGGGLNESDTPDLNEASAGSYNFDLALDSSRLSPRLPFDLEATTPTTSNVSGFLQLIKRDDTVTTLVQSGATVYEWDGASTFSSRGTVTHTSQLRDTHWSLDDYIVITDIQKDTVVKKWDGTTFGTLTTGLGTDLYAKYGLVHQGRVWLFNVKTSTDTPHLLVASAFENPTSYDTTQRATTGTFSTGLEAFYMLSPDLRPINGAVRTVAGDLVISTLEGGLFKLSGSSASDYKWTNFYPSSQAVGDESIVSTGNDVVYMRKGGNIESLAATEKYGDVRTDDLSRWIRNTVSNLTGVISVYDQENQKVLFFTGSKVLVLFKDILLGGVTVGTTAQKVLLSPWSVYSTQHSSGFQTSAARYMRVPGSTDYSVYFGGTAGQIFNLNGTEGGGDAGSESIELVVNKRLIDRADGLELLRHVTRGNVRYRRIDEVGFNIAVDFADEYAESVATVMLKGSTETDTGAYYGDSNYYGGSEYYNAGTDFLRRASHTNFSVVGKGEAAFVQFSVTDTGNYQVDFVDLM